MSHENCIFCKIAAGQIPGKRVFEDDQLIVIHDINPAAKLHLLVIPKRHIETLADCRLENPADQALLGRMLALAPNLAREQGHGYADGAGGFRVVINTGPDGGQEVYHLHMHVLAGPRPWKRMG
ncbi:MAG: histidine triad nucleotide-binding protein [Burkholderiales bacterium]|nr:histidine triad nucleotide-binding protein [Burkholderiales bacterium]MDE2287237.1 histidine triad nucleotide-binding protein [Burkholderiales bacterium]MDE2608850.1 histidine triad nucleotide-binding protein [Burkholderiales bacterium]